MRGIYYIKNLVNGKKYIGSSKNLTKRLRDHKSALRVGRHHNIHLQRAWNKYGEENFKFVSKEFKHGCLLSRENKYIKLCGHYNIATIAQAFRLGYKMTEEEKLRNSLKLKKAWSDGKFQSKLSKVSAYDVYGNLVCTYDSIRETGYSKNFRRMVDRDAIIEGYRWRYGCEDSIEEHPDIVCQMNKDKIVDMFQDVKEASTLTGVPERTIYGNIKRCGTWRRLEQLKDIRHGY